MGPTICCGMLLGTIAPRRQSGAGVVHWQHSGHARSAWHPVFNYPTKRRSDQKINTAVAFLMGIDRAMIEDEDAKGLEGFLTNPIFGWLGMRIDDRLTRRSRCLRASHDACWTSRYLHNRAEDSHRLRGAALVPSH
jgi:hypothetical protein